MNHSNVAKAQGRRVYAERSFIGHKLDDRLFEALNRTRVLRAEDGALYEASPAPINAVNGYCLDAPDSIPQGCMGNACGSAAQLFVMRGVTWSEHQRREGLMRELIAEVLGEGVTG